MGYKEKCPECGKYNLWVTPENGLRYCFNCAHVSRDDAITTQPVTRSPNVEQFREIYTELTNWYATQLLPEHRAYLVSRGISEESIARYRLGFCPNLPHNLYSHPLAVGAGIVNEHRVPHLLNRITIPYLLGDTVVDIRGRAFGVSSTKYLSLRNPNIFRGSDYLWGADEKETGDGVIYAEGEFKAIAAKQLGYVAYALPGITSYRHSVYPSSKQIIMFDSQRKHVVELRNAIIRLAKRLPNPYVSVLPLRGEDKQDIDSYILRYGAESFAAVYRAAQPYQMWLNFL